MGGNGDFELIKVHVFMCKVAKHTIFMIYHSGGSLANAKIPDLIHILIFMCRWQIGQDSALTQYFHMSLLACATLSTYLRKMTKAGTGIFQCTTFCLWLERTTLFCISHGNSPLHTVFQTRQRHQWNSVVLALLLGEMSNVLVLKNKFLPFACFRAHCH